MIGYLWNSQKPKIKILERKQSDRKKKRGERIWFWLVGEL